MSRSIDLGRPGRWFLLVLLGGPAARASDSQWNVESRPPSEQLRHGQFFGAASIRQPPGPRLPQPPADAFRIVNLLHELTVAGPEFRRLCPTAAGGCIPRVDVALSLDPEDPAQACGCRPADAGWRGFVQVVVSGKVVLYDQASGPPSAGWPFQSYDQRVDSTCTARAHEYGYHLEGALEAALSELGRFLGARFPSSDVCERYFLHAQRRARQAFQKALAQSRVREAQLRKVGWYPKRSRFGLGWAECS